MRPLLLGLLLLLLLLPVAAASTVTTGSSTTTRNSSIRPIIITATTIIHRCCRRPFSPSFLLLQQPLPFALHAHTRRMGRLSTHATASTKAAGAAAVNGKAKGEERWIDLQVPADELRPEFSLTMGQCFNWKRRPLAGAGAAAAAAEGISKGKGAAAAEGLKVRGLREGG